MLCMLLAGYVFPFPAAVLVAGAPEPAEVEDAVERKKRLIRLGSGQE